MADVTAARVAIDMPPKPPGPDLSGILLEIGAMSGPHQYVPRDPVLFRFEVETKGVFAFWVMGDRDFTTGLYGPGDADRAIEVNDGSWSATLKPGVYYFRVARKLRRFKGTFHLKVARKGRR